MANVRGGSRVKREEKKKRRPGIDKGERKGKREREREKKKITHRPKERSTGESIIRPSFFFLSQSSFLSSLTPFVQIASTTKER